MFRSAAVQCVFPVRTSGSLRVEATLGIRPPAHKGCCLGRRERGRRPHRILRAKLAILDELPRLASCLQGAGLAGDVRCCHRLVGNKRPFGHARHLQRDRWNSWACRAAPRLRCASGSFPSAGGWPAAPQQPQLRAASCQRHQLSRPPQLQSAKRSRVGIASSAGGLSAAETSPVWGAVRVHGKPPPLGSS